VIVLISLAIGNISVGIQYLWIFRSYFSGIQYQDKKNSQNPGTPTTTL
jgi:hypothetical protein